MTDFIDKKTGEIKTAFNIREDVSKYYISFKENGHEYTYFKDNI